MQFNTQFLAIAALALGLLFPGQVPAANLEPVNAVNVFTDRHSRRSRCPAQKTRELFAVDLANARRIGTTKTSRFFGWKSMSKLFSTKWPRRWMLQRLLSGFWTGKLSELKRQGRGSGGIGGSDVWREVLIPQRQGECHGLRYVCTSWN
ncbi:unnamed protein product [Zymoseptoria tritici ST99CH_3D7]|uniref:Uncharacterized protein n=1 Tax=Zymoseptoria tritici (strain ST99CH_3D7) TaxID=1276538 RepID=A0A1X7S9K4_ZYMT9|nr:unnamed protein product [Zymoseptoria tritici ST99CH_3D7]